MSEPWHRPVDPVAAPARTPLVSVVIPARNEAANIEACLDAVLAQDWPAGSLEVIVVDGCSEDGTAALAKERLANARLARCEVVENPTATTPANLNLGLALARGSYVGRVDAHSLIPPHYVRRCVEVLAERREVAVVGGRQVAVPPTDDAKGRGIARGLNNRYTMGFSRYRRGASSGPSDTVYLGVFRTDDLREVGGWDERLTTNQDFDLNRRLSAKGLVWFDASLEVGYVPRATYRALFNQYRRFGASKVAYWRTTGDSPQPRQLAALAALPVLSTSGVLALAARCRSARDIAVLGGASVIAAFAIDQAGPQGAAGPLVRLRATAATGCATAGWSAGVWARLLAGHAIDDGR